MREESAVKYEDGRIYFTKQTERKIFFALTVFMLVMGIFYKAGWL